MHSLDVDIGGFISIIQEQSSNEHHKPFPIVKETANIPIMKNDDCLGIYYLYALAVVRRCKAAAAEVRRPRGQIRLFLLQRLRREEALEEIEKGRAVGIQVIEL